MNTLPKNCNFVWHQSSERIRSGHIKILNFTIHVLSNTI
jgi:hypothetical protein